MDRLSAITLDESAVIKTSADAEHERAVAIYDLIEDNRFCPCGQEGQGPFALHIALIEGRLQFVIRGEGCGALAPVPLPMSAFRKVLKDYFLMCDSYYEAIRTASPAHIETLDHERRALHDEGAKLLAERLGGKIAVDHNTARRLFTLISALHWKG